MSFCRWTLYHFTIKYILFNINRGKLVLFKMYLLYFLIILLHYFPSYVLVVALMNGTSLYRLKKRSDYLFTGVFSPFTFIINISMFGYFSAILFYVFYLSQLFYICFYLLSRLLLVYFFPFFFSSPLLKCIYTMLIS